MQKKVNNWVYILISAILAMFPFVVGYTSEDGVIYTPMIADAPQHLEMEKGAILFFAVLFLIIAGSKFITNNSKKKKTSIILSVFFALCVVFGKSYEQISSWGYIFSSFSGFVVSLCTIAGYSVMFYYAVGCLFNFIDTYDDILNKNLFLSKVTNKVSKFLEKQSLIKLWVVLMILWLPYLIIDYPAIIHADSGVMLSEYLSGNLYNHHPVIQTIVWGSFVDFGNNVFDSYNVGVFLYVLIQFMYGSFIVSLLFDYIYKKGYPVAVISFSFLIMGIMPAFPRHATAVCKDSNYTFFVLFMVWLIFKTIDLKDDIWKVSKNRYLILLWIVTILFVGFSRKSGIHLAILTIPCVLIYMRKSKTAVISVLTASIIGFVIYFGGQYAIANVWEIGSDDIKETYSIPFQQTARFVRDYGDDVEEEEAEIIDEILDYNSIAEKYNPEIVDPVKNTFREGVTNEDVNEYLGVWFKQFFRHPTVYIQATLNTVYGYFYPENIGYYKDLFFMSMCVDENMIYAPEALKTASEKLCDINMKSRKLPVIGLFSSLGFYVWIAIFVMAYFMKYKGDKKFAVYNIPSIITILICVASPANNTMRYGLVVMYLTQILICMCFNNKHRKE